MSAFEKGQCPTSLKVGITTCFQSQLLNSYKLADMGTTLAPVQASISSLIKGKVLLRASHAQPPPRYPLIL